ncbi:hypothetical protein SLS54_003651 [Diplodia seriata]
MQQDELAALFQQSLNFQTTPAVEHEPEQEQSQNIEIENPQQQQQQEHRPAPIIYASTHYTPNNLISRPASAPNLNSTTEPTSPSVLIPLNPSSRTNPHLVAVLARNDIDIADLSPGQLELFTGADADQQLRLLELWRITLRGAIEDGVWTSATSLEMEERLARERWERLQHQPSSSSQAAAQQRPIRLDTGATMEMEMMTDDEGSTASPTSTLASPRMMGIGQLAGAEPYMLSGYEQLAKRDYEAAQPQQQQTPRRQGMVHGYSGATDPVYKAAVENQYGAFQAMREYGGGEGAGGWYGDDEMVM